MISTIVSNAKIIDGTGTNPFSTDVALHGERIARIGDCSEYQSLSRIDGRGCILAPGFIDACSFVPVERTLPTWNSASAQGITSAVALGSQAGERWFTSTDRVVREDAEAGAAGIEIDLAATSVDEAVRLAGEASLGGAPAALVHLRESGRELLAALDEALEIARRADVRLHIAHLQARRTLAGTMERALERIDRARASGLDVSCDLYPYVAVWIELEELLPAGITRAALDDERIAAAAALEMEARLGDVWHELMLAEVASEERLAWCGMRFDEIGRQMRLRPARAVLEFVRRDGAAARAFFFTLNEDDVATALSASFCSIGTAAEPHGFRDERFGLVHPRTFGTSARLIGRFVRQRRTLTMEEAVFRMSGLVARTFGFEDRGTLAEEMRADLVLFDERAFVDTATYERPVSAPAGLKHLWIAGRLVPPQGVW